MKDNIYQNEFLSKEQALNAGFSFCIITAGKRPSKLNNLINSIKRQSLTKFEIIVAGNLPDTIEGVTYLALPEEASSGKVAVVRNRAMQHAQYETVVMCDDDIVLDSGFAEAIAEYGKAFNILCVRMKNPDGSRCWDWATVGGPTGHRLMSYDEKDKFVYVSSGIFVISKKTLSLGLFNENLGFYQAEDVEFSQRLKAQGATIDLCRNAGAMHDDHRYTQFDDYPRRIINFHAWEDIADGVSSKAVYAWDGRAYPIPQDLLLRLTNVESGKISYEFNIVPLSPDSYAKAWSCRVIQCGATIAEIHENKSFNFSLSLQPNTTAVIEIKCSDNAVGFCKGAFRDQRAVAAYMLKPIRRQALSSDLILASEDEINLSSAINKQGLAIFAGCMNFSDFAASSRALIRDLYSKNDSLGLELHTNDYWFAQLCFGVASSKKEWSELIKKRQYGGINLVCADTSQAEPGFFRRAISSRPGFSTNIAVATATEDSNILEELSEYSDVFSFSEQDCSSLIRQGIRARLLSPKKYFPDASLSTVRKLPNQRAQAVTIIVDQFSDYESLLIKTLQDYTIQDDISIVLYVVDKLAVSQQLIKKVQGLLQSTGQANRTGQVIVSSGSLQAVEELEFLKFSLKLYNLLTSPTAARLDARLAREL